MLTVERFLLEAVFLITCNIRCSKGSWSSSIRLSEGEDLMPKAKVWTEIYYEQCIPKHWDFFPDSRASLDYFPEIFCMLSSRPFPIVLKVSHIFSHQVVSLLHWYQSFIKAANEIIFPENKCILDNNDTDSKIQWKKYFQALIMEYAY